MMNPYDDTSQLPRHGGGRRHWGHLLAALVTGILIGAVTVGVIWWQVASSTTPAPAAAPTTTASTTIAPTTTQPAPTTTVAPTTTQPAPTPSQKPLELWQTDVIITIISVQRGLYPNAPCVVTTDRGVLTVADSGGNNQLTCDRLIPGRRAQVDLRGKYGLNGEFLIARVNGVRSPPTNEREEIMSNASKRSEGAAEELGGKIKKTVGSVIGNEQMEAEGTAKELQGEAKQEAAKAAERTKGKVEEIAGAVKNRIGAVIDNEQMQAEGKAKELKGEARQAGNK